MATRTSGRQTKRPAASRANAQRRPARRPGSRRAGVPSVAELEKVIRQLEARIADLTSDSTIRSAVSGATGQVGRVVSSASNQFGELVADSLTNVADHVRNGANSVTGAARLGTGAIQKIGSEIEKRPLMTIAIALGIGFLAAMTSRREAA